MNLCRFTPKKTCERQYGDCENCRVPNSFGYFMVLKGSKLAWERKFILERDRAAQVAWLKDRIAEMQSEIKQLRQMPGRERW